MSAVYSGGMRVPRLAACVPSAMPEYMQSLTVLQRVLDFQEALAEKLEPRLGFRLEEALAKWREGRPLFAEATFHYPPSLLTEALQGLEKLLQAETPAREACRALLQSHWLQADAVPDLMGRLLQEREAFLEQLADELRVDAKVLGSVLRTVLSPYFVREAAPYQEWITEARWRRGFCPICGCWPGMARLAQEDGRRVLACCLCHSEWAFDRLRCPFCEQEGKPEMRYFTVEGDEVHRIECCEHCKAYIKTVDERKLGHPAHLIVEDMITAHLDALAQEQGYH
ncbi:MAG: formate dehydrogenase accessory protein FdhE [Caldilineae bacterium]|nr:MAG: formate dehydrogenase accessory protein FdhE [Caldilineae bacterium]